MKTIKSILPNFFKRNFKLFIKNVAESILYYVVDAQLLSKKKQIPNSIVFVCKGNVCRSVFAEERARNLIGDNSILLDSCGLDVDQGSYPPKESVQAAKFYSCNIGKRKAKGVEACNIQNAGLIVPMEYNQYKRLLNLYPEKKQSIHLLRKYAPFPYCLLCNIYDPYGWGMNEFKRSNRLVDLSLRALLQVFLK